jgi:hypothetical protein
MSGAKRFSSETWDRQPPGGIAKIRRWQLLSLPMH